MKDFDELKSIWSGQQISHQINFEDLKKEIKSRKKAFGNKLLLEVTGMSILSMMLIGIAIYGDFRLWSSQLSILVLLVACLYYIGSQISHFKYIQKDDSFLQKPTEYIVYLKHYKNKRFLFNTTRYLIFSITATIAFTLYLIEFYFFNPIWHSLLALIFEIIWVVFCWKIMKFYREREQQSLTEIIDSLEKLQTQFNSTEEA